MLPLTHTHMLVIHHIHRLILLSSTYPILLNRFSGVATLVGLEKNLNKLISWVQDPNITPDKRFALLQDIAEEAARYKLGGDDKIRVAGGACDGVSRAVLAWAC